jgi:3-hydroxyacyl-CoA dehydrogenase
MTTEIRTVAVIGGGTMGSGIAAACAAAGRDVLLLEATAELAARAGERVRGLAVDDAERALFAERLRVGILDVDGARLGDRDWICEAVVEDLRVKRDILAKIDAARRPGSIVSTNTSGIPLRAIVEGGSAALRADTLVTHFFNPVRVMRLLELVAGADTRPQATEVLRRFLHDDLGKGVVVAKDTPNFIGNRIGCFFLLSGLNAAVRHRVAGIGIDEIDALISSPVGLPGTGLFGLVDLIGLDVLDLIARNLDATLPSGDIGRPSARLPSAERRMLERGQLGRKSGGGFYRMTRTADGGKVKEVFDPEAESWSPARRFEVAPSLDGLSDRFFADAPSGRLLRDLIGAPLLYAADLVPEISDEIVAIDRAMRWGFAWKEGPFQLLDRIGPTRLIGHLRRTGRPVPHMLGVLEAAGETTFHRDGRQLGADGRLHPIPPE